MLDETPGFSSCKQVCINLTNKLEDILFQSQMSYRTKASNLFNLGR